MKKILFCAGVLALAASCTEDFDTASLQQTQQESGIVFTTGDDAVATRGEYLDENGEEVLKDSLSAGEKQLMIIAILWALALCSQKKLPVIIDTPLSRLDSQHRTSVITTYFPNASEQIIILSTDTEIDRSYYDMIQDSIGDEFTLVYNEETKSTSIKKGYFQES